jgi:hypothetical protein
MENACVIKIDELRCGTWLLHSHRGVVRYTEACEQLMTAHGDPTSCFVEDGGEVIEVSIGCLSTGDPKRGSEPRIR